MSRGIGLAALALVLLVQPVHARVWTVYHDGSGDAPTIQAAIDSSVSGDVVAVFPGTYAERITMKDNVSLLAVQGPDVTFLEAPAGSWWIPLIAADDIGGTTLLYGFTIGGGDMTNGLLGSNCSLQIRCNQFVGNIAPEEAILDFGGGAAIAIYGDSSPMIEANLFRDNHHLSHHGYGVIGGTLWVATDGWATIRGNEFADNGDVQSTDGGIAIWGDCTIDNNLILHTGDQGEGISVLGGEAIITNNTVAFTRGIAWCEGNPTTTGIEAWVEEGWIGNNTVYGNRPEYWCSPAPTPTTWGGIRAWVGGDNPGTLHIQRNLVVANGGYGIFVYTPERTILSCNLTYGNAGEELHGIAPDPGHIFENPFLCDPDNDDFRIADNSPAVTLTCGILGAVNEICASATGVVMGPSAGTLLLRAVPNPFNPTTTIHATVPVPGRLMIEIYDVRGRRVSTLFDRTVDAGDLSVEWNGTDARGESAASGVYFVRATASGFFTTEKIVLLK